MDDGVEIFFVHFSVPGHFLKLETFVRTSNSVRRIVEAFDGTFFSGRLIYAIVVLPPEEGSFLSKLAIWVGGGTASIFAFANSDIGAAYIEGLTGKTPAHFAKVIGEKTAEYIEPAAAYLFLDGDDVEHNTLEDEPTREIASELLVTMTRGILDAPPEKINKINEIVSLPEAMDARAEFYRTCMDDETISAIGFFPDDDFPIPRNSFPERAVPPQKIDEENEVSPWRVAIETIYVTSPNWDREDQLSRQWKGKDQSRRDCYFVIEDDDFWRLATRKNIQVEILDQLKVQWAYQEMDGKAKNRRVLRVLEFNNQKLAEPLEADELITILDEVRAEVGSGRQLSLFPNLG